MAQNPLENFADAVMQGIQRRTRQGRIGRKEVDGSRTIEVPTRPHFVYVRAGVTDATGEVLEAYNGGAPHKFGTPVLMIRWNRTWRIIGIDIDSPSMDKDTYSVAYHVHSVRAGLPQSFLDLLGMPNAFGTPGQVLTVNDTGDNLYFGDPGSGGGSPDFLGLTDTPDDYTGQGGKYVKVNGPEDALIFGVLPAGFSGAYGDLTGVPSTFAPSAHASSHKNGGSDEVATATPGANEIPKAEAGGKLADGWINDLWLNVSGDTMAGNIDMATTNKIINLANPSSAQDAATKAYVDATLQALDIKASVRVATTANITLSGTQTIDGVAAIAGDRVLVKDQTAGSENGIYVVAAGAWSRAIDADISAEVTSGMYTFVTEGTVGGDNGYVLTTNDPITLGTTALVFTQFSGAGQVIAGSGLSKSGNTLDVNVDNSTIEISSDITRVKDSGITYAKIQNVAANKVLGSIAGGVVAEIAMTSFGRTLAALADAAAGIAALGLDAIYGRLAIANTWTANNAFNSTATSGSALSATRNLTATSTDGPVVSILQDHPSDDQSALLVAQDGQNSAVEVRGPNAKSSATASTPLTMYSNDAAASALALLYQINGNATAGLRYTSIHSIEQGTAYRPLVLNPNADVMAVTLRAFSAAGLTITDDGGNVALFVEDGGFVGVGPNATNPTVSLHVRKDQNTSTVVTVENQTDGNIASALFQALNAQGDSMQFGVFPSLHSYGAVAGRDGFMYSSSNVVMMADAAAGIIKFATGGNAEKARIDANGRMGIGTTNPVANSAYSRLTVSATDATAVYETIENLGAGQAALQLTRTGTTPSGWVMYIPGAEDALAFYNSTLNANVIKLLSTGSLLVGVASASAKIALQAGTSTNDAAAGGVLYVDSATHANGTTLETTLGTYSVPANTLSTDGMSVVFEAWVTITNNANTKTIKLYFGATSITLPSASGSPSTLYLRGHIIRTGAATQDIFYTACLNNSLPQHVFTTSAETLSGAVVLKLTGQSNAASNDVKQEMFKVWWEDANT